MHFCERETRTGFVLKTPSSAVFRQKISYIIGICKYFHLKTFLHGITLYSLTIKNYLEK